MQDSKRSRVEVSADGTGLVSRAGVALLRELTGSTGPGTGWSEAILDTYDGMPVHLPGRILADLAVMIADGGNALEHLATLRDQDNCSARWPATPPRGESWTKSTTNIWLVCRPFARRRRNAPGPPEQAPTSLAGW